MTTTLEQLRADVAGVLNAGGVAGYGHVPERITPPGAIVLPDQPYVSGLDSDQLTMCGTWRVRLRVVLLNSKGTNAAAADALDGLIVAAVTALDAAYDVRDVAEPAEVELNGAGYLGTVIRLETLTDLTNDQGEIP